MFPRVIRYVFAVGSVVGLVACNPTDPDPGPGSGVGGISNGGNAAAAEGSTSRGGAATFGGSSPGSSGASTGGMATNGGSHSSVGVGGSFTAGGGRAGTDPKSPGGTTQGSATTGGRSGSSGRSTGGVGPSGGTPSVGAAAGMVGSDTGGRGSRGGATNGGSSAMGGSGAAAGSGYRPCPTNGDPCKILPLGDSITWGIQYDGAYRVELFRRAVLAKQKITFTGSVTNGPSQVEGVSFPKSNEGHSGWTISQIASLVPSPAFDTTPHIVLLMIGTNDVYAASGQAAMPDRLGALMDKITNAAPNALLVVAKITPLNSASWNATIKTYNDAMKGLVQSRASAGKHVVLADMNTGFTSAMLSTDNVHPNKSGYDFMGERWYTAISDLLPE